LLLPKKDNIVAAKAPRLNSLYIRRVLSVVIDKKLKRRKRRKRSRDT